MELPCVVAPLMEDVIRKTPPSGLVLNVGAALRRRWRWDLVLIAQHCFASYFFLSFFLLFDNACLSLIHIHKKIKIAYLIPFLF